MKRYSAESAAICSFNGIVIASKGLNSFFIG